MSSKEQQKTPLGYGPYTGPCAVCGKADAKACSKCRVDFYCGKEHQTEDWKRHKKGCGAFELRVNATLGRHLVATKDIPAGTIIMRETPLVAVPTQTFTEVKPLCVGCCSQLEPDSMARCAPCGWPVCGEACSRRAEHKPECATFQRADFKLGPEAWTDNTAWNALSGLRVYLAGSVPGPIADRLAELQGEWPPQPPPAEPQSEEEHLGPEAINAMFLSASRSKVNRLLDEAMHWLHEVAGLRALPVAGLRRALAVAYTNSLAVRRRGEDTVSAVFAGISMLEHSCVPNTMAVAWAADVNDGADGDAEAAALRHEHVLAASRDVARGEHLSLSYQANPLRPKGVRRAALALWGFVCRCELCADPDERGLHLSAWYCGRCHAEGRRCLVRLDGDGVMWLCRGCGRFGPVHADAEAAARDDPDGQARAIKLEARVKALRRLSKSGEEVPVKAWERVLDEALWPRGPLHPTHHAVLCVKRELVATDPDAEGPEELVRAEAARLAVHCRDLLAAVATLSPRGQLEFRAPLLERLFVFLSFGLATHMDVGALPLPPSAPRPELGPEGRALEEEATAVISEMMKCVVTPGEKAELMESLFMKRL